MVRSCNYTRTVRDDLSFRGERLLRGRHRIHPYPAMLHPLLVDFLIDKYAEERAVIFDPFCGSGVTLLQSKLNGYESVGFDINPIALLIARAKTRTYGKEKLREESKSLSESLHKSATPLFTTDCQVDIPEIKNRDYWYSNDVVNDLGKIRWALKNQPYEYSDFFLTIFAFVCRNQSLTRNGEFKRYRISKSRLDKTKNEVFPRFFSHLKDMVTVFLGANQGEKQSTPILANSEDPLPSQMRYDLVITSPPYGDSRTTVAYGQYTSFGSEWLNGLVNQKVGGYQVDSECLGRRGEINKKLDEHEMLTNTVEEIKTEDPRRASDVFYFFNGYYGSIRNVVCNLNPGGTVCYVVGNRTVKGVQIPMDQITASFLDSMGMEFKGIFIREISNKVMPLKNSPTNKAGVTSTTMANEFVVVFEKPESK